MLLMCPYLFPHLNLYLSQLLEDMYTLVALKVLLSFCVHKYIKISKTTKVLMTRLELVTSDVSGRYSHH